MTADHELIAKAQKGDRMALNSLVTKYWQPIYRLAFYKTGNADDAQEIAQETFVKALRSLPRYQEMNASFKTYLGRIALNLVKDYWRKQGRTPQIVDISEYQEPLADTGELPEDSAIRAERQREVLELVGRLPQEQRQAVELRIIQGMAVGDTARIMGKTEAAVKMLQQRALKHLRKLFEERGLLR